ncbi:MAG TPA: DUF1707 domain-containing protein [Candidatus Nanopelagicales bacterium]|nr:DUF1707 domain-containing protein [Candidatus Nanopelagicales bacterium]
MNNPELRVGDAERDSTIAVLREAFAEGRLDQAEFDDRLGRAHIAKTVADLSELTVDLPGAASADLASAGDRNEANKERRDLKSAWASWLGVGVLVNIIWFGTWMGDGPAPYYWPIWVIGPWGGGMLIWTLTSRAERSGDG